MSVKTRFKPQHITPESTQDGEWIGPVPLPPSAKMMGWRLVEHDPDACVLTVSFEAKPEFLNPMGIVQGGILSAMMDDVMGPVVVAATGVTKFPSTTDLHTTFYSAAKPGGRLIVTARIDRLGGTIAYTSAEVRDEAGELIAKSIQTARLLDIPAVQSKTKS